MRSLGSNRKSIDAMKVSSLPIVFSYLALSFNFAGMMRSLVFLGESTGPVWNVPLIQMSEFVGRKDELRRVRQTLFETRGLRIVSVLGLGGIGKSRFALEFTSHIQSDYPYYSVFWVQATTQITFENDLLAIGKKLQIPGIEDTKADVKTLVKQRLSDPSSGKWLLILDNADDELLWGKPSENEPEASLVDYCLQ